MFSLSIVTLAQSHVTLVYIL